MSKEEKKSEKEVCVETNNITYTPLGTVNLQGKLWQLLRGSDKKWYKSEFLRETRFDEKNRSPLIMVFSDEILPFTKKDMEYFV